MEDEIFERLENINLSAPQHSFSSQLARYAYIRDRIEESSQALILGCGISLWVSFYLREYSVVGLNGFLYGRNSE